MRILFLIHEEADFLEAQLYLALCGEVGPENVVDHPIKWSYHGKVHRYPSVYVTDPGAQGTERWEDGEVPMGETSPFPWMVAQPVSETSFQEVVSVIGSFDLVVMTSPRATNTATLARIIDVAGRGVIRRLVMVDGEDYDAIRWDLVERFQPDVYFKRDSVPTPLELYPAQRRAMKGKVRICPLPLAPVEIRPRRADDMFEIDVAMLGGDNTPGGSNQYAEVISRVTPNFLFGRVGWPNYTRVLARSKIAVCPRGHSQDSLRSWETLAVEGPMVFAQKHTLIRPYPFLDGIHVALFDGPADLETSLRSYLLDETSRAAIAAQGHAHLVRYHSPAARARYFLKESFE